ncbi:MAG: anaerobic ribonucleoside triphosphate reductase [Clostridia bacterium]|nr:anaerobic ribonucleoside triphosphate reductase [Clostridia bacterium]
MSIIHIRKRDGREVPFDRDKIEHAIFAAFQASGSAKGHETSAMLTERVVQEMENDESISGTPTVEQVQDTVERVLIEKGFHRSAKAYILYRAERSRIREMNTRLMRTFEDIVFKDAIDSDIKRENANINGDTAMGSMLKFGSEGAKQFYETYVMDPRFAEAHRSGDIHIHDMDFYTLTTTCCQIELKSLFKGGFSTGHGYLREPQDITSYAALACIAIQANQNDQHGGQAIVDFDYGMAPGVKKTFIKRYRLNLARALELLMNDDAADEHARQLIDDLIAQDRGPSLQEQPEHRAALKAALLAIQPDEAMIDRILDFAQRRSEQETDKATYQAMEALVHNLNTMNSRAGAQVPFSSINYGMDISPEGRMVVKNVLLATESGLGGGETPIFPIQIFRVKEGVNFNAGEPNYDLYRLAIRTSAKRLFPNFSFVDAPFNLQYYKPGCPETEIAYMGCRTRVMGNAYDPDREMAPRRGNLSFTSINLPRIALKANGDVSWFFEELERKMQLVVEQLDERFAIISKKKVKNFPFLMGEGVWIDSEKLDWNDTIGEVLKHGTLTIGFIGLAEALKALRGAHHGESEESQNLGIEIVSAMRAFTDRISKERGLNYSLIATPAEGLSGRFIRLDKERFGIIPGVTEKEYYTNSFHVPVYYPCSAFHKLSTEAPYHALTNGGHISYVEMDGDPLKNLDAFEKIVRFMHDAGIGYGSINHPVDRDPECGYNGIINDECPCCHRTEADGRPFERIRRITGYLVGTLDRFNNAKRAEERDRVKHGTNG